MKVFYSLSIIASILVTCHVSFGQEVFTREIEDFSELNLTGNIRVELYKSDKPNLEISVKNIPAENLITEVKQGRLSIRLKTGSNKDAVVKVKVNYSDLENITVASGGLITSAEVIKGKAMNFNARSGGKMELELELDELKAEVTQGAILVFKGEVKRQKITVNTGATYSAYLLEAEDSYVKSNSAATAKVRAKNIIEGNASIAGFIGYIGDPESENIKTTLGGKIEKYKTNEAAGIIE